MEYDMEKVVFMIGKWQELKIQRMSPVGAYLGDLRDQVLLPKKQVPQGAGPGDVVKVFLYKDSDDRLIATVNKPKITIGEIAPLKVKQITKIGAFLDWGLEKDLLLPFRQQTQEVKEGVFYPVVLYLDKSSRLAASMWIDKYVTGAAFYIYALKHPHAAAVMERLQAAGVPCGTYYPVPLHLQGVFCELGYRAGDLPVTEELSKTTFAIPVFPELHDEERGYIIKTLIEADY